MGASEESGRRVLNEGMSKEGSVAIIKSRSDEAMYELQNVPTVCVSPGSLNKTTLPTQWKASRTVLNLGKITGSEH